MRWGLINLCVSSIAKTSRSSHIHQQRLRRLVFEGTIFTCCSYPVHIARNYVNADLCLDDNQQKICSLRNHWIDTFRAEGEITSALMRRRITCSILRLVRV